MPLFPSALFDSSILTSVLVGLLVVWALQETLGWNSTGIVVPGYLASVLVLQPTTAVVMVTEALVACLVARAMTHGTPRWWPWTAPFGRDRFFLILAVSVLVRILFEAGGLARLVHAEQGELHSMGLVLVPLMANALWRTGVARGALQIGVPLIITYLVLRLVLLPLTNLDLSDFELSYEDVARDFAASPKAYILLLTGAWLGSVFNVRYGWDFGGLIVPGLLALCWLTPLTVGATLVEALAIAAATKLALSTPWLRNADMSGSRPLVLAFVLGFAGKFAIATFAEGAWPGLSVRSLFGFGYLLPSIIALRVVKHRDPFRVAVPIATVSFLAFTLGSVVGYALDQLGQRGTGDETPVARAAAPDDALVAAWWEGGQRQRAATVRSPARTWAPDGPGASRTDPDGHPFGLFAAAPDDELLLAATAALTDRLEPHLAHVCTGSPAWCATARHSVERAVSTVEVVRGPTTELAVREHPPEGLDLTALVELAPGLRLVQHEGPPRLSISDDDLWRLAGHGCEHEEGPTPDHTRPPTGDLSARQLVLREILLPAVAAWATEPQLDRSVVARCLASRVARELGLHWHTDAVEARLQASRWTAWIRRGPPAGLVWAPLRTDEPGGAALAAAVFRAEERSVLVISDPDPLQGMPAEDETVQITRALVRVLSPEAPVTTVRAAPDGLVVGADLIESGRSPLGAEDHALPHADGSALHLSVRGGGNPLATAAAQVGAPSSTVYASTDARSQMQPLPPRHLLRERVEAHPITWSELSARRACGSPGAELSWLDDAVDEAVDGGDLGFVRLLATARAHRAELTLLCEDLLGCRWLHAEQCRAGECRAAVKTLTSQPLTGVQDASWGLVTGGHARRWQGARP